MVRNRAIRSALATVAAFAVHAGFFTPDASASPCATPSGACDPTCAAQVAGPFCPLERPLVLRSLNMPPELQCTFDEDGNGLDDDMEQVIANCFVPEFHFDSEEGDSRRSDEPKVLFSAMRTSPDRVSVKFALLFAQDGGYRVDPAHGIGACPLDDHHGDTEWMALEIRLVSGATESAQLVSVFTDGPEGFQETTFPWVNGKGTGTATSLSGTHPKVFPSAGKHHMFQRPSSNVDGCDIANRYDRADGLGAVVVPCYVGHVPPFAAFPLPIANNLPLADPGLGTCGTAGEFCNACTYATSGRTLAVPATRSLHSDWLDDLGYPGERVNSGRFCGGAGCDYSKNAQPSTVSHTIAFDQLVADADGDGLPEVNGWYSAAAAGPAASEYPPDVAIDKCPASLPGRFDPTAADADGDGVPDECDPDPSFRQSYYVAGGSSAHPARSAGPYGESIVSYALPLRVSAAGGWEDSDRDGYVDGHDRCPSTPRPAFGSDSFSANRWGEDSNYPPLSSVGSGGGTLSNNRLGLFQRGDACDPYPVTDARWGEDASGPNTQCGVHIVTTGTTSVGARGSLGVGMSANDPQRDAPPSSAAAHVFKVGTYRCACRAADGTALFGTSECLDSPTSDCFRGNVPRFDPSRPSAGRGWIPMDQDDCARTNSFCDPVQVTSGVTNGASRRWDWLNEVTTYGPGSATPHFGSADVTNVPPPGGVTPGSGFSYLGFRYALWSEVELDARPATFQKRTSSLLPDPDVYDSNLSDVGSVNSRRLRAAFDGPRADLSSPHTQLVVGAACDRFASLRFLDALNLPDPPPDGVDWAARVSRPGLGPDARMLATTDGTLGGLALLRPLHGNYARVLTSVSSASGSPAGTGTATMLRSHGGAGAGGVISAAGPATASRFAEPDVLWLGHSETEARWARLRASPASADDVRLEYAEAASGTIPSAVGPSDRLVSDIRGGAAALIRSSDGAIVGYDGTLDAWTWSTPANEWLRGRVRYGAAMLGSFVLVAGGTSASGAELPAVAIDALGRWSASLGNALPSRRDPIVTASVDGNGFIMAGGIDAAGRTHDDVWAIDVGSDARPASVRRLRADTRAPGAFIAAPQLLLANLSGSTLSAWSADAAATSGVQARVRSDAGWAAAAGDGSPQPTVCAAADTHAGEACRLDPEWYSLAGRRACATGGTAGECQGSAGALAASATIPGTGAVAADTDGTSVWVLRSNSLELWGLGDDLAPTRIAQVAVPGPATDLRVAHGVALVLTQGGVLKASRTATGIAATGVTSLCGRPVRVTPVNDTTWAVATTLSFVVVSESGPGLKVTSTTRLVPGPNRTWTAVPVPAGPLAAALCKTLDSALGTVGATLAAQSTALARVDDARVLLAGGPLMFELANLGAPAPSIPRSAWTGDLIRALRVDDDRGRAYAVGVLGDDDVFDLRRTGLPSLGHHDVRNWVEQRSSSALAVRVTGGRAQVAKVIP